MTIKIKFQDFLNENSKRLYTGNEVWDIDMKGGSEHNDSLEYLEDEIKGNDYYLSELGNDLDISF